MMRIWKAIRVTKIDTISFFLAFGKVGMGFGAT